MPFTKRLEKAHYCNWNIIQFSCHVVKIRRELSTINYYKRRFFEVMVIARVELRSYPT